MSNSIKHLPAFVLLLFVANAFAQTASKCPFDSPRVMWNGALKLNDTTSLYFYFDILPTKQPTIEIYNAEEVITVNEVTMTNDSLFFRMPVFDSEFRVKRYTDSLVGNWINHARTSKNVIPFKGIKIATKPVSRCMCKPFAGKWEVDFSPNDSVDHYKAVGIFRNPGCWDLIYGTFLTETGDYRYLSGAVYPMPYYRDHKIAGTDTIMEISCFDGSHAFYFKAKKKADGTMEGDFYSGAHWHEKWIAKRNDSFGLRNADSLTFLKPGYKKMDFTFPNVDGKKISLSDAKYKNKVVIVQLMGSWCPNCMDETAFLAELQKKYKSKGVEVIALAFEKTADLTKATDNVKRLKSRFNADYEFLITGKTGKEAAAQALPMLNQVMAFPTTIYIDKKGNVRKIYTGFSGPGTGDYYKKYVEETTAFIEQLLKE